jgi:glycosyltransferase involved in cell wall biosynthesis
MAMNLRLLMVNSAAPTMWGGGEMWYTAAAEWFAGRSHAVRVVGRPGSRFLEAVRGCGIDAVDFEFGGDYDPLASFRALTLQTRFRPNVVLVNFNKEAWLFGRGAKLRRTPVVARHGLTLFKDKRVHRIVYRQHMDAVIVNSPSIKADYAGRGLDVGKVHVILNGVRPVEPRPGELRARLGLGPDVLLVGAAGRLDPQKRFDRFVEVAERIAARGIDARFVLLGDGDELESLRRRVQDGAVRDRFDFAGFVPDFAARCGDLDLYLLTSANEGTPNALLEAMARGVPSVAFGVGATPEILSGECAEGLVEPGDVAAMSNLACALLTDAGRRDRLAAVQRERARGELSFESSMLRYEELLRSLRR